MAETTAAGAGAGAVEGGRSVIDCDVHDDVPSGRGALPLPARRTGSSTSARRVFKGADRLPVPAERADHGAPGLAAEPTDAAPARASTCCTRRLLDPTGVERGDPELPVRDRQPAQSRRGGRVRQRGQRLADRRVARQGAAAARLDRRAEPDPRAGRRARSSGSATTRASSRSACRSARSTRTAAASTTRCGRRSRATIWSPASTSAARPAIRPPRPAGPRTTSRSTSAWPRSSQSQLDQHRLRGRLRPVPDPAGRAARERLHLAAGLTCGASTRSGATCAAWSPGSSARRRSTSASTSG